MRLYLDYLDTSLLGAVLDRDDPRRVSVSRALLEAIAGQRHVGVISNVVEEELEQSRGGQGRDSRRDSSY